MAPSQHASSGTTGDNELGFQREEFHAYESYKAKIRASGTPFGRAWRDSAGNSTRRLVDGIAMYENHLLALCHLRDADRVFYTNRMEEVTDPQSGRTFRDFKSWRRQSEPPATLPTSTPTPQEKSAHLRTEEKLSFEVCVTATENMVASLAAAGASKWSFQSTREADPEFRRFYVAARSVKANGEQSKTAHSLLQLAHDRKRYIWELYRPGKGEFLFDAIEPSEAAWRELLKIKS